MRNITVTLTDEQYNKMNEIVLENKAARRKLKSLVSIYQHLTDECIANHINKLVDKQTPKLPSSDTPPVVIPSENPFASLKF